jgi:hypothetical protein
MENLKKSLFIALAMSMAASVSHAKYACELVFQVQSAEVQKLVQDDAYMQWLKWEQTANFAIFHKTTDSFALPLTKVSSNEVKIDVDKDVPQNFLKFVEGDGKSITWFKHPHNTSDIVPYLKTPATGSVEAYYTASRSVALGGAFRGLTIKMGTDRPHGPTGQHQPGKADTADDVRSALLHSAHLKSMDQLLGKDSEFFMLPEIMTVADKNTKVGYVIRDIRDMDTGYYYLPALSIPYVGREIAQINGKSFDEFWGEHYGALLGRAKAKMLLRYGLQMETPNSQNMLIQFDRNMHPTGRIFFRDISDAVFVSVVGRGLGFNKEIEADIKETFDPHTYIKPFWSNSSWRFDEAGALSVSKDVLNKWGELHNRAYQDYLSQELGVSIPGMKNHQDDAPEIFNFFASEQGHNLLQAYMAKHEAKASAK